MGDEEETAVGVVGPRIEGIAGCGLWRWTG
jgi:hypothetical protein